MGLSRKLRMAGLITQGKAGSFVMALSLKGDPTEKAMEIMIKLECS